MASSLVVFVRPPLNTSVHSKMLSPKVYFIISVFFYLCCCFHVFIKVTQFFCCTEMIFSFIATTIVLRLAILDSCFFVCIASIQSTKKEKLPTSVFELRISGVASDHSTNCATTSAQLPKILFLVTKTICVDQLACDVIELIIWCQFVKWIQVSRYDLKFFLNVPITASFVYFRSFHIPIQVTNIQWTL